MKKLSRLQAGTVLAALLAISGFAGAAAQTPPAPAPAASTFEQRLAQRKSERGVVLDEKATKRLVDRCSRGQTKIRALQIDDVKALDNRADVYKKIDAKLWIVIGQLKLAGQDTFHLEEQRAAFVARVSEFNVLAANYRQALDDILLINCQADPVGFKALLDTSRLYNDQLRTQTADTRNLVINSIKNALRSHADALEAKSSVRGSE